MDTTLIILIVVVVVLLIALAATGAMLARRRRSEQLQEHYGPEYERTVSETGGDRRTAEQQLVEREKRHRSLDVRDLEPQERERFAAAWTDVQRGFVDDPVQAVQRADGLVDEIMRTRGYPVDDFDRRAEDISVEHPQVVQRYRDAREIHDATRDGRADTEQQRRAVTSYRELIDALIGDDAGGRHAGPADGPADGTDNHRYHDTTDMPTEEHTR